MLVVRFLGTHNAESRNARLVSLLIDESLAVDAGSLTSELTLWEQEKIKAILLSHGHYDHIRAIPSFAFNNSSRVTKVFATLKTLQILSSHLIDGVIYPEFASDSSFVGKSTLELLPMEILVPRIIQGYEVTAIPVSHPLDSVGFNIVSADRKSLFYTGDTGPGLSDIWEFVSPQLLIVDVTFPNRLEGVAIDSGHLCPKILKKELTDFHRTKGYLPEVAAIHVSLQSEEEIREEVGEVGEELGVSISIAREGEELTL